MRTGFLFFLFSLGITTSALAQGNPIDLGRRSGPQNERERYYSQVRIEANELMIRWQQAWEKDDGAALARLYTSEGGYFPIAADARRSRDAIRDYFAEFLKTVGNVEIRMIDFGTSGDLAYVTNRVSYYYSATNKPVVRTDMLVLRRSSRQQWEIEAHLTREEPAVRSTDNLTH